MPTLRNAVRSLAQEGQAAYQSLQEVANRASESHYYAIQAGATDGDIHRAIEDVEKLYNDIMASYQLIEREDAVPQWIWR